MNEYGSEEKIYEIELIMQLFLLLLSNYQLLMDPGTV